jgi:hypothetical protein
VGKETDHHEEKHRQFTRRVDMLEKGADDKVWLFNEEVTLNALVLRHLE